MRPLLRLAIITLCLGLLPTTVSLADPLVGGCQVFPLDNPWNADISGAAVHANSANYIANINANGGDFVHPDFGSDPAYGIPYITVSGIQPKVPITFDYADESDPGYYPFPANAPIEGGSDHHVIAVDTDNCVLYETWDTRRVNGAWAAGSGAIFNLNSNALRPDGWTSADAAGLPIFPGLARCSEAMSGVINHALRFTVNRTQKAYIYPATHYASNLTGTDYPPMGLRFRLKTSYLTGATFTGQSLAIATALNKYGMILADNGSNWYISGERDQGCWDDDDLNQLKAIPGTAFDVIESPLPATVVLPAPSLHLPIDGGVVSGTQPVLGWNTVTGAASYEFRLGRSIPALTTVATQLVTSPTQYVPTPPLLTGFTYFWQVRAVDAGSNPTAWSSPRSFAVASTANVAPLRNLYSVATPTLTWIRTTGAVNYKVQVSATTSFASPIEAVLPANVLTYTTPALPRGVYYWRVQAQNAFAQWSAWSASDSFIVDI